MNLHYQANGYVTRADAAGGLTSKAASPAVSPEANTNHTDNKHTNTYNTYQTQATTTQQYNNNTPIQSTPTSHTQH